MCKMHYQRLGGSWTPRPARFRKPGRSG